jgi:hypothetical protein
MFDTMEASKWICGLLKDVHQQQRLEDESQQKTNIWTTWKVLL